MRAVVLLACAVIFSCSSKKQEVVVLPEEVTTIDLSSVGKAKLSEYGFFEGELKNLSPVEDVIPYTLNAALFTDYAFKQRFVRIPKGGKAHFNASDVFGFPDGTVLIKNFYYPA